MKQIESAYDMWARTYDTDKNITRDLDAVVTRKVLADRHFQNIIECGCGTGKNSGYFSDIADQVWCVDFSREMIAVAKLAISSGNVHFVHSNINLEWPFTDGFTDLVSCNLVLQHVEDLSFVFSEARRVLKKAGIMFVSELHPIKKFQGSMARYTVEGNEMTIPAYNHHITHYVDAALGHGLALERIHEWWHDDDAGKQPRLVTFLFRNDARTSRDLDSKI